MTLLKTSIKLQLLIAYAMLILPLLLLGYSSYSTHHYFHNTTLNSAIQTNIVVLTGSLQHDIIDLQRNTLIYKNSDSQSALKNINALYARLKSTLQKLKETEFLKSQTNNLISMENHLEDYKNNFDIVLENKKKLHTLINNHTNITPKEINKEIDNLTFSYTQKELINSQFQEAQAQSIYYLLNGDQKNISQFKKNINTIKDTLKNHKENEKISEKINSYKKYFLRIVSLKRNYTFLINVVMAGSAREIIYYSKNLTQLSEASSNEQQASSFRSVKKQQHIIFSLLGFGILMAIATPFYFFGLITKPIQKITVVFKHLSSGNSVSRIPGLERQDEIGQLARAADIFKAKNEQTTELLQHAKNSIIIQQNLNKELTLAKLQAEKSLSVKSDFLANMSHELRTPLNSVIGYTVRLLKKPDNYDPRQLSSLNAIERNGKHLLAMINDILDLSKIEANKLELRFEKFILHNLCENVIDQLQTTYLEKGLRFIFDFKPTKDFAITSDPLRLSQILINLISNSIKYTEHGWVKFSVELNNSNAVIFVIADSGIGIKDEDMKKLFNRFEQFDSETRFNIGHGTGLGLAIVDNIAKLLGAKVSAQSEYNVGSTFTITLPTHHKEKTKSKAL